MESPIEYYTPLGILGGILYWMFKHLIPRILDDFSEKMKENTGALKEFGKSHAEAMERSMAQDRAFHKELLERFDKNHRLLEKVDEKLSAK